MNIRKGVIFDLDGVIVDTAKFHFLAWRKLANDLGFDFTPAQNEELKGVSRVHSLQKILHWGGIELSEKEFQRQMNLKNENYLSYIAEMKEEEVLPGVTRIIGFLEENKIPFALGSASKNARVILQKINLLGKFDAIVDGNDVSKAKPDPEVFLIAAGNLGLNPEENIVFEDSVAGIEAANKADMLSIGVGDKNILGEADYIFPDLDQLQTDFLKQFFKI